MDAIFPSDIGCYTLGFLPPLSMADYVVCMGMSTGCVGGFAQATGRKIVTFIGDSTFFHSGIPGLINAVFNRHNFTLVILDNGTTAMTGHQPHPGVDMTQLGVQGHGRVSIENLVRGIGVPHVTVIKPYKVTQEHRGRPRGAAASRASRSSSPRRSAPSTRARSSCRSANPSR